MKSEQKIKDKLAELELVRPDSVTGQTIILIKKDMLEWVLNDN